MTKADDLREAVDVTATPAGGGAAFGTCPDHLRPLRDRVYAFMTERVEPAEPILHGGDEDARARLRTLQDEAKAEGLWALGHPKELGGGGLPFLDYVYVNEVQGR